MKMGHMDRGHGDAHEAKGLGGTWVYFPPGVAFQVPWMAPCGERPSSSRPRFPSINV